MIRNLLDADDQESPASPETEKSGKASPFTVVPFEVPEASTYFVDEQPTDAFNDDASSEGLTRSDWAVTARPAEFADALKADGEALMLIEKSREEARAEPQFQAPSAGTLFASEAPRESVAETMRKSGLAWSAAIVLGGSVIFMMILGWFADLLLGTGPWGIVAGIVLGGVIGFVQFFRITSQIFKQ